MNRPVPCRPVVVCQKEVRAVIKKGNPGTTQMTPNHTKRITPKAMSQIHPVIELGNFARSSRYLARIEYYSASSPVAAFASPSTASIEVTPAFWAAFFHCSHSAQARWHSFLSLSQLALSSEMACSVSSFSSVHFSMFCVSLSLSCVMNWTARARILPLFFSQPGTILAISLMPSLMVSRRRRSTEPMV